MTTLSDYLNDNRGEDFNVDARVEAAERAGHKIDRATVFKVLNGDHAKNPRESTIKALAYVFELDVRDVRDAAGKPRGELGEWTPTAEAARLNQDQRDALDQLIKVIVREGGWAHGNAAATTEGSRDPGSDNVIGLPEKQSKTQKQAARRVGRPPSLEGEEDG